jgi:uncharacterized protein (DUF924 family)
MPAKARELLDFWFIETPASKRYSSDPDFDAEIRERFLEVWKIAKSGGLAEWEIDAPGALALTILLDQFPRNMFRGQGEAFSTDAPALETAKRAVARDFDLAVENDRRMFFYMPYMHAENLAEQDECIRLITERRGVEPGPESFAVRHRNVISRFGRFPARNAALGRATSSEEADFLAKHPSGF